MSAGLILAGDSAATLANVQANPVLFRVGIASTLVMFVSVFVLIAALYATVEPSTVTWRYWAWCCACRKRRSAWSASQPDSRSDRDRPCASRRTRFAAGVGARAGRHAGWKRCRNLQHGFDGPGIAAVPVRLLGREVRAATALVGFGMLAYVLVLVSGFTSILAPGSAIAGMDMVMAAPVMLFELVFGLWLAIRSVGGPVPEHPKGGETVPTGLAERTAVAHA